VRVAWVHPSWRDLVIDHLSSDRASRERFLRNCSVHGALVALSIGGGVTGDREIPLLRDDSDWDALTDRLYELVPELEAAELVDLMDAVEVTIRGMHGTSNQAEADALGSAVLARVRSRWASGRTPIPLVALETWLMLAAALSSSPEPPAIAITWAELLPTAAPHLSDPASLERFADWLTLADLLIDHDPDLLAGLGFPGHSREICEGFLSALEHADQPIESRHAGHAVRALRRISRVIPELAYRGEIVRFRFRSLENLATPPTTSSTPPALAKRTGHLDVRRVLEDL
jgi:hypothetical protein